MSFLANKKMLIVGGTGSFGTAFTHHLLKEHPSIASITIFSRDEQKQFEFVNSLDAEARKKIKFAIGDVRDGERVLEVVHGHHVVVHAAAMKHVPIAEANMGECLKTNVSGTHNLVHACLINRVEKVVALSTDKAVMPINTYGASKLLLEKTVINANAASSNAGTALSVVRYANVLGSRGSVVPFFQKMKANGVLPITNFGMTRFSITMEQAVALVMKALADARGGEIFVPKAPSYKITTVAEAIAPGCSLKEVGIREGEKLHELMVSRFESLRTIELPDAYVVLANDQLLKIYLDELKAKRVPSDFEYDSSTNVNWLTVEQLRSQIDALPRV